MVILGVENHHDARVAELHARSPLVSHVVDSKDSLESLPETGIIHMVVDGVSVFRRTAALEVHVANPISATHPSVGEVGELRAEVVVCAVAEASDGGTGVVESSFHQDFVLLLSGAIHTIPVSIEVAVVWRQLPCADGIVASLYCLSQVSILGGAVEVVATLRSTEEQGFCEEVGGSSLSPCDAFAVGEVFALEQVVCLAQVVNHLVPAVLLRSSCEVAHHTGGRSELQCHAAILSRQAVVVVSSEEIGMSQTAVAHLLILDDVCLVDDGVARSDAIIHLVPEVLRLRAVPVCTLDGWSEAGVVFVPCIRSEVVAAGEFVGAIERDAVSPLISEMPANVSIERHGEGFEAFLGVEVVGRVFCGQFLVEEVA